MKKAGALVALLTVACLPLAYDLLNREEPVSLLMEDGDAPGREVFVVAFDQPSQACSFAPYSDCGWFCGVSEGTSLLIVRAPDGDVLWRQVFDTNRSIANNGRFTEERWGIIEGCRDFDPYAPIVLRIVEVERHVNAVEIGVKIDER